MASHNAVSSVFVSMLCDVRRIFGDASGYGVLVTEDKLGYQVRLVDARTGDERSVQIARESIVTNLRDVAHKVRDFARELKVAQLHTFAIVKKKVSYFDQQMMLVDPSTLKALATPAGEVSRPFNYTV